MTEGTKSRQIAGLLLGTVGMLVLVAFVTFRPALGSQYENPKRVLSSYLIDTQFLAHCARRHPEAVERSSLLSPELRANLSQMLAACECCE